MTATRNIQEMMMNTSCQKFANKVGILCPKHELDGREPEGYDKAFTEYHDIIRYLDENGKAEPIEIGYWSTLYTMQDGTKVKRYIDEDSGLEYSLELA